MESEQYLRIAVSQAEEHGPLMADPTSVSVIKTTREELGVGIRHPSARTILGLSCSINTDTGGLFGVAYHGFNTSAGDNDGSLTEKIGFAFEASLPQPTAVLVSDGHGETLFVGMTDYKNMGAEVLPYFTGGGMVVDPETSEARRLSAFLVDMGGLVDGVVMQVFPQVQIPGYHDVQPATPLPNTGR